MTLLYGFISGSTLQGLCVEAIFSSLFQPQFRSQTWMLSLWSDIPNPVISSLWTLVSNPPENSEILGLSRMESQAS